MERIYEDETHQHSDGIFKDAIGTEWIHVETRVILIHLENDFGKDAQEIWERTRTNPDMHTMLLDQLGRLQVQYQKPYLIGNRS